jgi:CubicO group peptidase (beta-lactamase class C family)
MMMKHHLNRILLAASIVAVLAACEMGSVLTGTEIQAQKQFSLDAFETNIRSFFITRSVGFSYVIVQNGVEVRSDGVGNGRTNADGQRAMSVNDRMHIASVSKTITTAAVLRLIEDTPGLSLDSSIEPYLPAHDPTTGAWDRHVSIGFLTFRQLLSHSTGFDFTIIAGGPTSDNNDDASLQEVIANGSTLTKIPRYANQHHALFRVIVPNVLDWPRTRGESDEDYHSRVFGEYVQQVVFDPAGITAGSPVPPVNPNLYYAWQDGGLPGVGGTVDFSTHYGAYGWYLSAMDLGAFLATLRHTEDIITAASRQIMDADELGYWNSREGENGTYRMKQGGWIYTSNPLRRGLQAIIANYSAGVQAAVIVNSRPDDTLFGGDGGFDMASLMRDFFDDAFVDAGQ